MRYSGLLCACALISILGACTTTPSGWVPCENCRYSYRRVSRRHTETIVTCVIDGKAVDCKRNPAECPECSKRMQERKQD